MTPIVFLDIDGVLVPLRVGQSPNEADPHCVSLLNELTFVTTAVIVVSSSRRIEGLDAMKWWLRKWNVRGTVIGTTPDLSILGAKGVYVVEGGRGMEIEQWLTNEVGTNWPPFVILDDDDDMSGLAGHLVHTDQELGLTKGDLLRALAILGVPLRGEGQ